MRFYEFEAKALFAKHGIPLLKGRVATSAAEAKKIASEIGGPVVLKSQVLTGGRMKAGGVKFADSPGKLAAIVQMLVDVFQRYDLTLAEINPIGKTKDGRILVLDGHVDLEGDARDKHAKTVAELGIGKDETREARPPTAFEIKGAEVDAGDHRGVAGNVREFDGDLGLVIRAGGGSLPLLDAIRKHGAKPANLGGFR